MIPKEIKYNLHYEITEARATTNCNRGAVFTRSVENTGDVGLKTVLLTRSLALDSDAATNYKHWSVYTEVLNLISETSGDDLYKLLAFYQILYHITLCDVFM